MPIIIMLFIIYLIGLNTDLVPFMASSTSPWWTLFTFNFVHASFVHLAINCFVLWSYLRVLKKKDIIPLSLLSFIIVPISAYLSSAQTPTCGFSAVISVIIGYYVSRLKGKLFFKALFLIVFSYVFTLFFAKNINTAIHAYSFFSSLIISYACKGRDKDK